MNQTDLKAKTGVEGLDDILSGGLRRGRVYLLEGTPGTGKTTIAAQFLLEGAKRGESGLYITLSETEAELRETAQSHGWEFDPSTEIFELVPPAEGPGAKYPRLGKPYRQAELSRRVAEALGPKKDGDVIPFQKPGRAGQSD